MFRSISIAVVATIGVFERAQADPHLYCAINDTPYCGTPSEAMRAYNELHQRTSIVSDLNFELMEARTDFLRDLIDARTNEFWLSEWLPDQARFIQANITFYQYFKPGSYFDPNSVDPLADSSVTDRFGNAALIHANAELAWGNANVFGSRMGSWVAGGAELLQRSRELYGSITGDGELSSRTRDYFQDMFWSPGEAFSRAFDNDPFDYLINEEIGRFHEFENRFYADQLISQWTSHFESPYSTLGVDYGFDDPGFGVPYYPLDEGYFPDSDLFFDDFYDFPYGIEDDLPDWELELQYL
ncbi:hypothetical protein SAMN05443635_1237 [Roseobacter denitrificans OCh 114]|nr:hypothetical protein [Roseobacter denitrificans]SFG48809.1 hypothetical protein SAMN05443635_1237 [Roseobacter denitrificans OCh 114]